MSVANEYYDGSEEKNEVKTDKTSKASKKKPASKKQKTNLLKNWNNRFDEKKVTRTIGTISLLLSVFLFLSFFSYILTWKLDQHRVLGKGLFEFLFETTDLNGTELPPMENWLGKFGAWFSHLFLYKWFGIASFGIPLLLFLYGVKLLFKFTLLPLKKTTGITLVFMVWTSVFLAYFTKQTPFIGGGFGYELNGWLEMTFGRFGTLVFTIATGYIFAVLLFNEALTAFLRKLGLLKVKEETTVEEASEFLGETDNELNNTLADKDKTNDFVSERLILEEEDEDPEDDGEDIEFESIIIDNFNKEETPPIVQNETEEDETPEDNFTIEIPEIDLYEDQLSNEEALGKTIDDLGEYDPKLDLSSYSLPSIDLLTDYGKKEVNVDKAELEANKNRIVETLGHYSIGIEKIMATVGPTVTLYEIVPAKGVRISKIKNLEDDIALSLSALGIRIIAPIPGKGTIGIEVPNSKAEMVSMRSLIASRKFQDADYELPIVMGKTITNETFTFDLTKMPHLLVAGATGQGKSVGLNAILVSILYKKHPSQVKFVLVDPKKVELTLYNKIERHFLAKLPDEEDAIITDTSKVVNTLNSLCIEMDARYELLKAAHVRTIKEYNDKFIKRKLNPEKGHRYLPYIVVLIDEFADLIMTAGKEVEHPIARLAQLARAIGIHLIVATQRPSVNVITGMIKANFPARIAFRVLSKIDSRTILDASGADQLIGRGDMLVSTGQDLVRLQCGFVDTPEVEAICDFIGDQRGYPDAYHLPEYVGESAEGGGTMDDEDLDPLFADAARIVVLHQQGSASLLQRKLKLGYNRAGRLIDQLEGMNIIGPFKGSKARDVLFSDEQILEEFLSNKGLV